jgi:transketolase N-terminal domain/subunit
LRDSMCVFSDPWQVALAEITAMPALTTAGIRAKAGALGHALMLGVVLGTGGKFRGASPGL